MTNFEPCGLIIPLKAWLGPISPKRFGNLLIVVVLVSGTADAKGELLLYY